MFGLLGKISREQVDEWMAYDQLEPIGNGQLFGMLSLLGAHLAAAQGVDIPPSKFYPRRPGDDADEDGRGEPMSDQEFARAFGRLSQ